MGLLHKAATFTLMALRRGFQSRPPSWYSSMATYTISSGSESRPNVTVKKVAPNITLHQIQRNEHDVLTRHGRPQTTVLFFPFMYAPEKAIRQYQDLYLSRGMDIINITGDVKYFMWPRSGQKLARDLLDYLVSNETPLNVDHFLVHAMSFGCYMYSLALIEVVANPDKYGSVFRKINGQVFDSIAVGNLDILTNGVSKMFNNIFISAVIKYGAWAFVSLTKSYTRDIHDQIIDIFKAMPVTAPVLVYYALDDHMCHMPTLEDTIEQWRVDACFDVHTKCWKHSVHTAHLREHPKQYRKTLQAFMQVVGLEQSKAKLSVDCSVRTHRGMCQGTNTPAPFSGLVTRA